MAGDAISTTWLMLSSDPPTRVTTMTTDTISTTRRSADGGRDGAASAVHVSADLFCAWAGLIGVVLFVAGSVVAGSAPRPDASSAAVTAFLVEHRSALLFGTVLIVLSVPFFGCFAGLLAGMLRDAEGGRAPLAVAATIGWVLLLAIAAIGVLAQAALTWRGADQADASMVRFVYDMASLSLYVVSATAVALSVGATSYVVFRTGLVARWIAIVGLAEIIVNVVELSGLANRTGANAGGYVAGVGPALWAVWVVALAIAVIRRIRRERVASADTRAWP